MSLRVAAIWRHPVKSMQGEAIERGDLGASGFPFDRRWGVVDLETGKVLSAKREGKLLMAASRLAGTRPEVKLPDGDWTPAGGRGLDDELSAWLGRSVALKAATDVESAAYQMNVDATDDDSPIVDLPCPPGTFFDALPVHLLSTASLRAMQARHPGGAWELRRFRPTVLIDDDSEDIDDSDDSDGDGFPEDAWIGSTVEVGGAQVTVVAPTVRCVMTTRAQPGLERDLDIVKAVNRDHQSNLGVYAVVGRSGPVAVGDPVKPS
ncbi:MAG: MOSC N-terminal beta barrel domain-containing protein [Acidimicrobiia bacterium]|nr:MOSC N-terminal beta barrel domain-containing protein [Acidimicrobiia bacterium]